MDILHVGKQADAGGIGLYVDGVAYPVRNEKETGDPVFTARLLKKTTDTVTLEFVAENVGPQIVHIQSISALPPLPEEKTLPLRFLSKEAKEGGP